jgi:hypothetical protein
MKSPLKDRRFTNVSVSTLKQLIPRRSSVDCYGTFAAKTELSLSATGIKVNVITDKPTILQFWRCVMADAGPERMCDIIQKNNFKFEPNQYTILQNRLTSFGDEYYRSCLFFLLNRCSKTGQVSCGEFAPEYWNTLTIDSLRRFRRPPSFNVYGIPPAIDVPIAETASDLCLFPTLTFSESFLQNSAPQGYDTYFFRHDSLRDFLFENKKKTILVYNFHPKLLSFFNNANVYLIDKYANLTNDVENYEEAIVTNF